MPYAETTPIFDALVKELKKKQEDMEAKTANADKRLLEETSGETDSWSEE